MVSPFDNLDPLLCERCGEDEALSGSLLCIDCTDDDRFTKDEAEFWEGVGPTSADLLELDHGWNLLEEL
jgi:hypothetical protein